MFGKEMKTLVMDSTDHGLDAEGTAMLAALCSRSTEGPESNLAKVKEKGAAAFMRSVYLGFGHASVGKGAHTTVFATGVSMLAAKAIQDGPLYCGTESSTRYIPFSAEGVYMPKEIDTPEMRVMIDRIMDLYESAQPRVLDHLLKTIPHPEDVSAVKWMGTLKARTFDICRSFLPAGCKTVVVWNSHIENLNRELPRLTADALPEVCELASHMFDSLKERYPNSFENYSTERLQWESAASDVMMDWDCISSPISRDGLVDMYDGEFKTGLAEHVLSLMPARPKYMPYPDTVGQWGRLEFDFELDFGSYRDIQRHRKGNCNRSLLTPNIGFHNWYLDSMPADVRAETLELIQDIRVMYNGLIGEDVSDVLLQYMVPMGFKVNVDVSYPLDNAVYVAELRSGPTVHPTLRPIAQAMGKHIEGLLGIKLHCNTSHVDALDVRRAGQTIEVR